ncbi:MAG TPA: S8 family serine peptidase, partial [Ilumatobacteraceae bacterium]
RATIRKNLMSRQDASVLAIRKLGATVSQRYVDALNAATIVVKQSDIDAVRNLPDVLSVTGLKIYQHDNDNSDNFSQVKAVWEGSPNNTGQGEKIALIDTGIDYKHADFGGTLSSTFPTSKVVGGMDLVGDAYNANGGSTSVRTPHPDNDPMDCEGHGTHVAGTAAGEGVDAGGNTYTGPYNSSVNFTNFDVAPGAAPGASLMIFKVFGCTGGVDNSVLLNALNDAVADEADVINMSLGSEWGHDDDPDAVAADNAVLGGAVVVISAGNAGPSSYLVGSPSSGDRVLSVAAVDATPAFPGATITSGPTVVSGIDANGYAGADVTAPLHVIYDSPGQISLGCDASDYDGFPHGDIAVVLRGTCARAAKPALAEAAGAVATIMINNASGLPPYEGTGLAGVNGPFVGVDPADQAALVARDGTSAVLHVGTAASNPTLGVVASFSSGGPRAGDSAQKPDVSAPGVAVKSALLSTSTTVAHTGSTIMSGTSMAAPNTSGVAALVLHAHPTWT